MKSGPETRPDRRNVLKVVGGSVFATTGLGHLGPVSAQDAAASVTLNSQESGGDSIDIASLHTEVDARLFITPVREADDNLLHRALDLNAGASFTDRTVQLDKPIRESKTVSAVIQAGADYDEVIASDTAPIAVGESVAAGRSSQTPGGTGPTSAYNTAPGVQKIERDSHAGFHSPYFLYTPETPSSATESVNDSRQRPLLVQVYPWGEFRERVESSRERIQGGLMRSVANATNCPVLVAPLPFGVERFGLQPGTRFTDPRHERVDLQLLAMIEDARSRLDGGIYTVADRIHFAGGSSAGVFIDTFAALHPEHVSVFSSGANGIAFLPIAELTDDIPTYGDPGRTRVPWPIGVADFDELVDREFDREEWLKIDQFRWIGAEDQDPENPDEYVHKLYRGTGEKDALVEEIFGSLQVDHRFETSRKIYDHLGVPATFTAFEGTGHVPGGEKRRQIIEHHQHQILENFEVIHLVPRISASEISAGDSVTVTVTAENPTPLASTTTISFAAEGTAVDTIEREIAPNTTTELSFDHTFDEPGTYTLTVNGRQVDDGPVTVNESTPTRTAPATTGATGPGFGVGAALAGVAGLSYLHQNRADDRSQ